ncbi:MAG: VWA domain-containing protein [Methanomicrobiales archaeon]|nr:VWA domain-containing protein [Methanomicrobiales archaeon]
MRRITAACLACLICLSGIMAPAAATGPVVVDPNTITVTLAPGEVNTSQISLVLPESSPRGDVVFVFDTTGSMASVLRAMKSRGIQVMTDIRNTIGDTRFGVASFMDYPARYDGYYGYSAIYGEPSLGDYDFSRDEDLTADIDVASAAINRIPQGSGGDWPQNYARAIYESRNFSWRSGAKRIYVIFGDAPPHAAPNGSTLANPWSTGFLFSNEGMHAPYGGDPGRDGIPYTGDDLDYATVVREAADAHTSIVAVYCPVDGSLDPKYADAENNFRYMASITGGLFVLSNPGWESAEISGQILGMIQEMSKQNIRELTLSVEEPGYRAWVTSADTFIDVPWPSTHVFHFDLGPPAGTPEGDHTFHIDVAGDGVILGTVTVLVHVRAQPADQVAVPFDVMPGDCPNIFNARETGVLTAAILGTRELDVSRIDTKSILLTRDGGSGPVSPIRSVIEDIGSVSTKACPCGSDFGKKKDRIPDLSLKFNAGEVTEKLGIGEAGGCIRVTVTGIIRPGTPGDPGIPFTGSDYLSTGTGSCGSDG